MARRDFDPGDVEAGREYVEAYVPFVHYVEGLYETAKGKGAHGELRAVPCEHTESEGESHHH